jgi:uncharacterized Tic20 family protein
MSFSETPPFPPDPNLAGDMPAPAPVSSAAQASEPWAPTSEERTLAMLAELLQLFSWFVGPLIIYFVKRDSPFVRFHALQAILWQAFLIVFYMVFFVVLFATFFAIMPRNGAPRSPSSVFPLLLLVTLYGLMGLTWLGNMIISIYFAIKAQSGAWAAYPVIGRLAKKLAGVE